MRPFKFHQKRTWKDRLSHPLRAWWTWWWCEGFGGWGVHDPGLKKSG